MPVLFKTYRNNNPSVASLRQVLREGGGHHSVNSSSSNHCASFCWAFCLMSGSMPLHTILFTPYTQRAGDAHPHPRLSISV